MGQSFAVLVSSGAWCRKRLLVPLRGHVRRVVSGLAHGGGQRVKIGDEGLWMEAQCGFSIRGWLSADVGVGVGGALHRESYRVVCRVRE